MKRVPGAIHLTCAASAVRLLEATGDGEQALRRFSMTAYTGAAMQVAGWDAPVVVDLAGLRRLKGAKPILLDHDTRQRVGHAEQIRVEGNNLFVDGLISGASIAAQEVVASSINGFPWQASVGAIVEKAIFVPAGKTAQANGSEVLGPAYVARKATLQEVSFVTLGADDQTSARVAAQARTTLEADSMDFEKWLSAKSFQLAELNDDQQTHLRAMFDAEQAKPAAAIATTVLESPEHVAELRSSAAAELKRQAQVQEIAAKQPKIAAQAIEEGWDATKTELEVLRASRPAAPAIHAGDGPSLLGKPIEAALCRTARVSAELIEKSYDQKTLEAMDAARLRDASIGTLLYEFIRAAGRSIRPGKIDREVIQAAFEADRQLRAAGGFSTVSLPGILGNVANKSLLDAYFAVPRTSQNFCRTANHTDFKVHTRYRMTMAGSMEQVGPDGELKHLSLGEQGYQNQLATYGGIVALNRQQLHNDDLEALVDASRLLGRKSATAIEKAVFTLLLSNPSSFFSVGNRNLLSGATSVLSVSGITLAEQKFMDQVDEQGEPVVLEPALMLVPTGLKVVAEQLFSERVVNETTTTDKPKPASNPHAGRFRPVSSPYLNAQALAGSSTTAWYLFANPADVAAMEIAYLNGVTTPTIESGETDFNTLGIQWRCYFDFGVAMQDFRAAIRADGV
jgi:hypothetical protein